MSGFAKVSGEKPCFEVEGGDVIHHWKRGGGMVILTWLYLKWIEEMQNNTVSNRFVWVAPQTDFVVHSMTSCHVGWSFLRKYIIDAYDHIYPLTLK